MRRIIAISQGLALAGYGIAVIVAGQQHPQGPGEPIAEGLIYLMFAALVLLVARGISRSWTKTPFLLLQLFAIIIGYTLLKGNGWQVQAAGVLVGLSGIAGLLTLRMAN